MQIPITKYSAVINNREGSRALWLTLIEAIFIPQEPQHIYDGFNQYMQHYLQGY